MPGDTSFLRLPADAQEAVKPVFERFEAAWIGGREPRIEDALAEIPAGYRSAAVAGLAEIELWQRRRLGGSWPTKEFLAAAHPELLAIFLEVRDRMIADEATERPPPGAETASNAAGDDALPRLVGRYQILEQLGTPGGQATVYLGRDPQFGRYVAVKVGHRRAEETYPDAPTLTDEGKFLAQIRHPNVVPVYDAGLYEGRPYLVMDYVPGDRISHRFQEARADPRSAASIVGTIADAVAAVHAETGIVHRDITPNNIIVTPRGVPMLFDFGLARLRSSWVFAAGGEELFHDAGTRPYMAPEQTGPVAALDERTDVFGLGGVLFFLLTGRTPRRRSWPSGDWRTEDPAGLSASLAGAGCPPELAAVCVRALADRPEERFPRASELAAALADWAKGLESAQRAAPATRPAWGSRFAAALRRHPRSAAATSLLAAFGLAAALLWKPAGEGDGTAADGGDEPAGAGRAAPVSDGLAVAADAASPEPDAVADEPTEPDDVWTEPLPGGDGLRLVFVPSGTFAMGSPAEDGDADDDERPRHDVTITRPFFLGESEVTVEQFQAFVEATGHFTDAERLLGNVTGLAEVVGGALFGPVKSWKAPGFEQADDHPAVFVSWNDAARYCEWLTETTGVRHRLPTEAEWEYACRAGTATQFHFGDDPEPLPRHDNVRGEADGFPFTAPVRTFPANPLGLFGMHGNIAEWCSDPYAADFYGDQPVADPQGPETGEFRVHRGGSYFSVPPDARSADRNGGKRGGGHEFLGFRVVREADPPSIVGRWKVARRETGLFSDPDHLWTDPVVFNADGTSSLGFGMWNYAWDGGGRFTAAEEGRPADGPAHTWKGRLFHRRLELSQPGRTPIVLERL